MLIQAISLFLARLATSNLNLSYSPVVGSIRDNIRSTPKVNSSGQILQTTMLY